MLKNTDIIYLKEMLSSDTFFSNIALPFNSYCQRNNLIKKINTCLLINNYDDLFLLKNEKVFLKALLFKRLNYTLNSLNSNNKNTIFCINHMNFYPPAKLIINAEIILINNIIMKLDI